VPAVSQIPTGIVRFDLQTLCFVIPRGRPNWHGKCNYLDAMDIARPDIKLKKRRQLIVWIGIAVVVLSAAAYGVFAVEAGIANRGRVRCVAGHREAGQYHPPGARFDRHPDSPRRQYPVDSGADGCDGGAGSGTPGRQGDPRYILLDLADLIWSRNCSTAGWRQQQAEADYKALQSTLQSTLMDKKIVVRR